MIICLLIKSVHTTQYGVPSLRYTGTNLHNSLSFDVKKIKPFSSFSQNNTNLMIDDYNTVINSWSFMILLSLTTHDLINDVILYFLSKMLLYSFYSYSCFGSPTRLVLRTV